MTSKLWTSKGYWILSLRRSCLINKSRNFDFDAIWPVYFTAFTHRSVPTSIVSSNRSSLHNNAPLKTQRWFVDFWQRPQLCHNNAMTHVALVMTQWLCNINATEQLNQLNVTQRESHEFRRSLDTTQLTHFTIFTCRSFTVHIPLIVLVHIICTRILNQQVLNTKCDTNCVIITVSIQTNIQPYQKYSTSLLLISAVISPPSSVKVGLCSGFFIQHLQQYNFWLPFCWEQLTST